MRIVQSRLWQFFIVLILFFAVVSPQVLFADTPTPTPTPTPTTSPSGTPTPTPDTSQQVNDLTNKIKDLEGKVSDLQSQERSLSSQIAVMDNQIKLTQYRIEYTQQQIAQLTQDIGTATNKITHLESSLTTITKTLLSRISETYQMGNVQPLQLLLSSQSFTDFVDKANYVKIVQAHDKKLMYDTVQAKNDYANQKQIFENKKQQVLALQTQLQDYTDQLDQEKSDKQNLLSETQGSEANYQRILEQTRAQLASFQGFVTSQGGASLLSGQTACDDWGCYYNQRDSQWGGNSLNGTSYTLADSGCLITSMAMVYTHYGHKDVTPQSINSVSSNFAGIPAALLKKDIVANGVSSSRISASIDSTLSSGNPVIVGISYDGGPYPDHFVVLISGSGGNYQMNDPYTSNGHDISFTSHYSIGSIREVDRVSM
ncbi:MAG TPA: C39 family peptidase [Patescibacteria group bacterium]|nr:C39 family peptidase [Patescibacteria group bacterium]